MPIKVRCEGCRKVFRVPDAARGKAIRCPKCQTKFRVKAAVKGTAKKKSRAVKPDSEEDLLAGLDLSEAEDRSIRICPKCASEAGEEDIDCPKCGVNLTTGVMSDAMRRKLSRKGPDPALYYKAAWKSSWQFTMTYKRLVFRTAMYSLIFSLMFFGCLYMVAWCGTLPPRVFWGALAIVAGLVAPGWLWFLDTEIIRSTLANKEKLPRISFDFFANVAFGIGTVAWELAFFLQLGVGLVGIILVATVNPLAGSILIGIGCLFTLPFLPLAMGHMSMPVTTPGWLIHKMLPVFFKNAGQALFWCMVLFATCLPLLATTGVVAAVSGRDMAKLAGTVVYNLSIPTSADSDSGASSVDVNQNAAGGSTPAEPKEIDWKVLIIPGIVWVVVLVPVGSFVAVFNMRSNGLLVFYCKRKLELIAVREETKYVSKADLRAKREAERLERRRQKEAAKRQKAELKKKTKKK